MSTVRTVEVGSFVLAMLLTLIAAGCRNDDSPAPEPRRVADREWRTVIADWYDDGEFDQNHRCRAIREARRHLPSRPPDMQSLHDDMRALEESACKTHVGE